LCALVSNILSRPTEKVIKNSQCGKSESQQPLGTRSIRGLLTFQRKKEANTLASQKDNRTCALFEQYLSHLAVVKHFRQMVVFTGFGAK